VSDNSFEINLSPFHVLHPIFNVDLLQPFFPPLLDTSKIAKHLKTIELNPDYMGYFVAEDPTLSGCQSREAPAPRQVAHLRPNLEKMSSSNEGSCRITTI
jgi:hypothetical protein